jgi:hypothetical protein
VTTSHPASRLRQILERLPDDPCCGAVCDDEAIVQRLGRSLSHFGRALRLPLRDPPLAAGFRLGFAACDDTLISDFVALAPEALPVYVRTDAPKRTHSSLARMDSDGGNL